MYIHKQFLQLGTTNILLLIITLVALYIHNFEMAFAGILMLLVSLTPFTLKQLTTCIYRQYSCT